ncbi:Alpha-L-fucosidase 3 [Bienertia sinuspersici]
MGARYPKTKKAIMRFGHFNAIIFIAFIATNLGLSVATKKLQTCEFPAIFNFGDSNSDTGGSTAIYGQAPPPNGDTFFGAPAGRFCDGRLVIDFLGSLLGYTATLYTCCVPPLFHIDKIIGTC